MVGDGQAVLRERERQDPRWQNTDDVGMDDRMVQIADDA